MNLDADIVIIGSGIGGATAASVLAPTGAKILILERGERLQDTPETRDDRAIFQRGFFRTKELWRDGNGEPFSPGNFYNVGGNSKFYGAILYRYRAEDFTAREHMEGSTAGWPLSYEELEPWYGMAEKLFRVRGKLGEDPTEPYHSTPYDYPAVPDEPSLAIARERLKRQGIHASSLPIAIDHSQWLKRAATPWDGFPDTFTGKIDAETGPLNHALKHENVRILTDSEVLTLETDGTGKSITHAVVRHRGEKIKVRAGRFVLAAGAVNSAALLLRSASSKHEKGLANSSDQVGRNFMNHNCTAMITIDPRLRNTSVHQKTFGFNDFYLKDPVTGFPLGNVQLLGKISGPIFKANMPRMPELFAGMIARYSFDWYVMSEDLPNPESRVTVDGDTITLDWQRSNMLGHQTLVKRVRETFRAAGFPIVLARAFDRRTPSHQCGTAKMGINGADSVVDPWCASHDIANLHIMDASVLPTSAAVNPALTIAALTLRAANHLSANLR
ncbi:GMC oxidoreductase [Phyllobacterium endophyticum]|uniref:GMC family oxidoreductase n=1 Tax=Phyllobacterium endophyticum TaxID=1149773 RepID=A0A2P7AS16_9HYPH|nr:GMC family oxidoreductase [Phyllobacterium endophyticum]MBB3236734.1 choline dehydrogenase-like flavoprotein [Phyllobacterium endophyticum]PSH57019.1 GMC family oxidoreductase [Phyllobacterium endophyticum]TYR39705.1 GMC family oxidoreductase [Phyllobacterium endophyticum]